MTGIVVSRLLSALPILLIVSLITFAMIHLIPGDPAAAIAGLSATPEQIAHIRHDLGLDQPLRPPRHLKLMPSFGVARS